ncbi:MAG: hypothetical protein AAFN43_00965 [Pseudomonadota bacterium]
MVPDMAELVARTATGKPRVLLIGGSSLGFSVSAESLSKDLNLQVYNLGVHAGVGYRNIWKNYRASINQETDLVVVSPSYQMLLPRSWYSPQHCDVVFLTKSLSKLARSPECLPAVVWRTYLDWQASHKKTLHKDNVYRRSAHNEFGDLVAHLGMDNKPVDYQAARDFLKLQPQDVTAYVKFIRDQILSKGYRVLLVPTVIPERACGADTDYMLDVVTQLLVLNKNLGENISWPQPVLCLPDDTVFNTAYHLNAKGRDIRTDIFKQWIKTALEAKQAQD